MFCFSETGVISETSVCCENFFYKDNEQTNKNSAETPKHVLHSNVVPTEDVLEENKSKTFVGSFEQDLIKTTPITTTSASTTTTKTSTISLLSATTFLVNKSTRIVENKNVGEKDNCFY